MPELATAVDQFIEELARRNESTHTIRNYGADLREFIAYFTPPQSHPPPVEEIDLLALREWLAHLYDRKLQPTTIRRKLASVRALFRYLVREHVMERDHARMLRLPKMPKSLPEVPNAETANRLVDGALPGGIGRAYPKRDRLLMEFLYGCGLRVSEVVGLNLEDIDRTQKWLRVRGKGRKERQVTLRRKSRSRS